MNRVGTTWRQLWDSRPFVADSLLALALTVALVLEAGYDFRSLEIASFLLTVPLAWRRIQPLPVFGLVVAGAVLGHGGPPYAGYAAIMIAAYSVGAYCRYRLSSLAVLLATAAGVDAAFGGGMPKLSDFAAPFVLLIPMWLVGNALRIRQLRADAFEDKATRLERDRELATRAALAAERNRIARELHDVVAHSVSVMVVQAGAARQVMSTSPAEARESLMAVESSGREAMTELRNLLGVLSPDTSDLSLTPQPGLDQLEPLLQRVGDAGLPVELRVEGRPRPLPLGVDLAAYRIVQEGLTNALKYSGLAHTEVILDYRDAELKVEILDSGTGQQTAANREGGRGLVGMQERVALYGGRIEAGARLEQGYAVRAWLPLIGSEA
jgi:signal transduction histidine kinase